VERSDTVALRSPSPRSGSVQQCFAQLAVRATRTQQALPADTETDTERDLKGESVSFTPHALYEQIEWEPSVQDKHAIEFSTRKPGHLRLLFDGGMVSKTGYGYGSFKLGDNAPKRMTHDYAIPSSAIAEWVTLIGALRYLKTNINPSRYTLHISGDAQNVVYALSGRYHPATAETVELYNITKRYLSGYRDYKAYWIPRELVVKHLGH
jgi:ribonuclease HI